VHIPVLSSRFLCVLGISLLALFVSGPVHAESQVLTWQLFYGEKSVGSREAKVLYLPSDTGEVRLLQAFTQLAVPMGAGQYKYVQRLGGRFGGARSFASSIEDNALVREVQGYLSEQGEWIVTVVEKGHAKTWSLPGDAIDMTSAEMLDPERAPRTLQSLTTLRVLATETGNVLTGPVEDLGIQERTIANQTVNVHRFKWSPAGGEMMMGYDDAGFLVEYEITVAGKRVRARLQVLPAARTFGGALDGPLTGVQVQEETL